MSFKEAITTCLIKKFATTSGRATRAEFWWFILLCFFLRAVLAIFLYFLIIDLLVATQGFTPQYLVVIGKFLRIIFLFIWFALAIPEYCVTIRRLHDAGYDGSQFLVVAIPIVGLIWLIVDLCRPSDSNDNTFGPNPTINPSTSD